MKQNSWQSRGICLFLITCLFCLAVSPGIVLPANAASMQFANMSAWAESEVTQALSQQLVPVNFAGLDLTRPASRREVCEAAVMLYETLHGTEAPLPAFNPFTDTDSEAIRKAYALGITNGTSESTFSPDATISREQVATLFGRTIRLLYPTMTYDTAGAPGFSDIQQVSAWALNHVLFMAKAGIIKGADGNFMPRPVTEAQIAAYYGTTSREQALVISLRIHHRFGNPESEVTPIPDSDANALERERLNNIHLSMVDTAPPPSDRARFDTIDFNNRFFRPAYEPILTLQAANPATGVPSAVPYQTFISPKGDNLCTFRWSLPAAAQANTSHIVWQVSAVPFQGDPIGAIFQKPGGLLLNGTVAKATTSVTINFSTIRAAYNTLMHPNRPLYQLIQPPATLQSTSLFASLHPDTATTLPKTFYVRAYPVDAQGRSIGDTGSGLAVIHGDPLPAPSNSGSGTAQRPNSSALSAITPDSSAVASAALVALPTLYPSTSTIPNVQPATPGILIPRMPDFTLLATRYSGNATHGGEFPNLFMEVEEVTHAITTSSNFRCVTPKTLPTGITELRLQVSRKNELLDPNNWLNPDHLIYEHIVTAAEQNLQGLTNLNATFGLKVPFDEFAPDQSNLTDELIPYHVRLVALKPGAVSGTMKAAYSSTIQINYGKSQASDITFYPEVAIDPHLPTITGMRYVPIRWESENWQTRYEVVRQPTMKDVFGILTASNESYPGMPVGTKLDMTPHPEDKSWWEEVWDAISDFFSDMVGFLSDLANWVSSAYADLKSGLVAFVAQHIPFVPDSLRDELEDALMAMVDYGLASIGLPPSLPNFDELSSMGTDYLAAVALEQAGMPVNADAIAAIQEVGGTIATEVSKAAGSGGSPNPMNWDFIRQDPDFLYQPACLFIDLYNPWNEATPAGTLSGRAEHLLDLTKNGSDPSITRLYALYGSPWVTLYKPVYGQAIPSLAPGQRLTIPVFLEEHTGTAFYPNTPPVNKEGFSHMYYGIGAFDFSYYLKYEIPPIAETVKARNLTEQAIYKYSKTQDTVMFSTEPSRAFAR